METQAIVKKINEKYPSANVKDIHFDDRYRKYGKTWVVASSRHGVVTCGNHKTGEKTSWPSHNGKPSRKEEITKEKHLKLAVKKHNETEVRDSEYDITPEDEKKVKVASDLIKHQGLPDASDDHPTLIAKGVKCYGLKVNRNGYLVMIMRNTRGQIKTVQYLKYGEKKKYFKGAEKQGSFFTIRGDNQIIVIVEGYSTGASVHEATGYTVIVAGDAGNINLVTSNIIGMYPESQVIICADNDQFKDKNTGLIAGYIAAFNNKCKVVKLVFKDVTSKPSDANDLHQLEGPKELKRQIDEGKNPLDQITKAIETNREGALKDESLAVLELFKRNNLADYSRYRNEELKGKVSVLEVDKALDEAAKRNTSSKAENKKSFKIAMILAPTLDKELGFDSVSRVWYGREKDSFIYSIFPKEKIEYKVSMAIFFSTKIELNDFELKLIRDVIDLLRGRLPFKPNNYPSTLLPLQNGMYNTVSNKLQPHRLMYNLTWILNYDYNPDATCETIMNWMRGAAGGSEEKIQTLLAFSYAVLFGMVELQRTLLLIGETGSGKSTYFNLLKYLVGKGNYVTTTSAKLERNPFINAYLYNKRVLAVTDAGQFKGDGENYKAISGGDELQYEAKNVQSTHTFMPTCMIVISTNNRLQSKDLSGARIRREKIIEMNELVPLEDQIDLIPMLIKEMSGYLNVILAIGRENTRTILKSLGSSASRTETKQNHIETNIIAEWAHNNVIYDPLDQKPIWIGRGDRIQGSKHVYEYEFQEEKLYPNFKKFLKGNSEKTIKLKYFRANLKSLLIHQLQLKGVTTGRNSQGQYFKGIRLRNTKYDIDNDLERFLSPMDAHYDVQEGEI